MEKIKDYLKALQKASDTIWNKEFHYKSQQIPSIYSSHKLGGTYHLQGKIKYLRLSRPLRKASENMGCKFIFLLF